MAPQHRFTVNHLSAASRVNAGIPFACPRSLYRDAIDREYSEFAGSQELAQAGRRDRYRKWLFSKLDERLIASDRDITADIEGGEDDRAAFAAAAADDAVEAIGTYDPVEQPYDRLLQMVPEEREYSRHEAIELAVADHTADFAETWFDETVEDYLEQDRLPPEARSGDDTRDEHGVYTFDKRDLVDAGATVTVQTDFTVRGVPDYVRRDGDTVTVGEVKTGNPAGKQHDMVEVLGYMLAVPAPLQETTGELVYAPDGPVHTVTLDTNRPEQVNQVARTVRTLTGLADYASAADVPGKEAACRNCDYNNPDNQTNKRLNELYGCPE